MKAKQPIINFLKIFLVAGIYLSFFAVQFCYNFDLANSQKSRPDSLSYNELNSSKKVRHFYQKASVESKANIRLNKRFEPKSFATCITPVTEVCSFFHTPEKLEFCYEEHLQSSIQVSALLRGPPSIA